MVKPDTDEDRRRKNEFAKRLLHFRTMKHWSQSDLWRRVAERMPDGSKFHRTSISRYESGANLPAPQILQVIAETLGVSPEQLLPTEMGRRAEVKSLTSIGGGQARITFDIIVDEDAAADIYQYITKRTAGANPGA